MLLKKFADALFIEININNIANNTVFDLIYLKENLFSSPDRTVKLLSLNNP